jgi:hypothetical protein
MDVITYQLAVKSTTTVLVLEVSMSSFHWVMSSMYRTILYCFVCSGASFARLVVYANAFVCSRASFARLVAV